jgi:hypothetical protein
MAQASSGELSDEEKLRILQRHDQFRQWRSLGEKRYCLVCGEIITGREICVARDKGENDPQRVTCPTEDCDSAPMEWVWPTDDVLIKIAMVQLECHHRRLIARAASAIRSLPKKKARNAIDRTRSEPPFG